MTSNLDMMRQFASQMMNASPQANAIGMETMSIDLGEAVLRVPFRPELVGNPDTGVIAGGVVTTLLDHSCGQAAMAAMSTFSSLATLDLRIDYMRPAAPGADIFCHAHCYKLTRSVAFVRAQAYDRDRDDPVATAQAAFMLTSGRSTLEVAAQMVNGDGQ